jgi:hypothetical protein
LPLGEAREEVALGREDVRLEVVDALDEFLHRGSVLPWVVAGDRAIERSSRRSRAGRARAPRDARGRR